MTMPAMDVEMLPIETLKPYGRNPRTHSKKQIRQIANSIERFGFTNPVLIGDDNEIIAGHGRVEAARLLGRTTVPTLKLSHLGTAERRAYVIADNKLALNAGWDREVLALELQGLIDLEFDLDLTGFSLAELDLVLDEHQESSTEGAQSSDDELPLLTETAVSSLGDVWQIGRHRLLCGDAQQAKTLALLMNEDRADLASAPP
jgi:ParB-like chromosome segregation protein Spo0J